MAPIPIIPGIFFLESLCYNLDRDHKTPVLDG